MRNYKLITNQRKNKNLIYDKYMFNVDDRRSEKNIWRCCNRKCQAKGQINNKGVFEILLNHDDHINHEKKIENLQFLTELKNKALNVHDSNLNIITEATKSVKDETILNLPKYNL